MGTGCNNNFKNDSCTDIISSDCLKWQGEAYSEFDICINDSLTEVTTFILDKIKDLLKGRGILLPDLNLDNCLFIKDFLSTNEKNLLNTLTAYKQAICSLYSSFNTLNSSVIDFNNVANYALGCLILTPDPCNPVIRFHTLVQAIINKLCTLESQYTSISSTILTVIEDATGNFLPTAIVSCGGNGISYSGVGAASVVKFEALVPPYCPILYTGTLTYFNNAGIGLPNTPMCGWFLCNGANSTPNSTSFPQNIGNTLKYIIRFD